MKNIANLLGIKSNERIVICDRSLSVIDSVGTELFPTGKSLAPCFDDETKANLENLISGKAAAFEAELFFPIYGTGELCFAAAMRYILFGRALLILRLYTKRQEYLSSEHFRHDVLSKFIGISPEAAPLIVRLYNEMTEDCEAETPSIDTGRFILRTVNELRLRYDYPHCDVRVDGTRGCFIRQITPEALVSILLSMLYVADHVCDGPDMTIGAYGSDGGIVLTATHTVIPTASSGVTALISAAPCCATALLVMELTAAKFGFETECVVRDGVIRLSVTRIDESKLTAFKSWDQFDNFQRVLDKCVEEMRPILFQQ